jgi:hypothetical protein
MTAPLVAPVVIQALPAVGPALPVPLAAATQWLRMASPGLSPYTQTLGNGQVPVQSAKTPYPRGGGFAGGVAPSNTFTLTVHGGGKVQTLKASPVGREFGDGASPYPLPRGASPSQGAGTGDHIVGGGAALFNGVVAINGDLVVWGKLYAAEDTHPAQTFRGNSASTTGGLTDVPYYLGTPTTVSVPFLEGLTTAGTTGSSSQVITFVSGVAVAATFNPDTCQVTVTATTTTSTVAIPAAVTWTGVTSVDVLAGISASSSAGTTPKIVLVR